MFISPLGEFWSWRSLSFSEKSEGALVDISPKNVLEMIVLNRTNTNNKDQKDDNDTLSDS